MTKEQLETMLKKIEEAHKLYDEVKVALWGKGSDEATDSMDGLIVELRQKIKELA